MENDKKILLIVEDEALMRKDLVERFSKEGYKLLDAADGEAGLELALKEQPDIILLDIILPKMDGMAFMEKIRQANLWGKNVPIILLTNLNVDDGMMKIIEKDKPAYYLVKTNWTMDQIAQKVKERLERIPVDNAAAELEADTKI